jgi:hypothetical protein
MLCADDSPSSYKLERSEHNLRLSLSIVNSIVDNAICGCLVELGEGYSCQRRLVTDVFHRIKCDDLSSFSRSFPLIA